MEAIASAKYLRGSAQKARLVVDMIRGKRVGEALAILQFTNKRAAGHIEKCLRSAIANATEKAERQNVAVDPDDLFVKTAFVDMGLDRDSRGLCGSLATEPPAARLGLRSCSRPANDDVAAPGCPGSCPGGDSVRVVVGDSRRGAKVGRAGGHDWARSVARSDPAPGATAAGEGRDDQRARSGLRRHGCGVALICRRGRWRSRVARRRVDQPSPGRVSSRLKHAIQDAAAAQTAAASAKAGSARG